MVQKQSRQSSERNSKDTSRRGQRLQKVVPTTRGGDVTAKSLHPRNAHRHGYNFSELIKAFPSLKGVVRPNPHGDLSIDFADPVAVKLLNAALIKQYYGVNHWDIPAGFLCPPVPGRVDYLHYVADLLANDGAIPKGNKVAILDIGTGANGIYPLLGHACYGWRFVASDVDPVAIDNVTLIKRKNQLTDQQLSLRLQSKPHHIFQGIINENDRFDITMCNPPFHRSLAEATAGTVKKNKNLAANKQKKGMASSPQARASTQLNFGGQKAELWCEGGEAKFLHTMIKESHDVGQQCLWFTSLVSKKDNVKPCQKQLQQAGAKTVNVIEMAQGNKLTRVIAWSYLTASQRQMWAKYRA